MRLGVNDVCVCELAFWALKKPGDSDFEIVCGVNEIMSLPKLLRKITSRLPSGFVQRTSSLSDLDARVTMRMSQMTLATA